MLDGVERFYTEKRVGEGAEYVEISRWELRYVCL